MRKEESVCQLAKPILVNDPALFQEVLDQFLRFNRHFEHRRRQSGESRHRDLRQALSRADAGRVQESTQIVFAAIPAMIAATRPINQIRQRRRLLAVVPPDCRACLLSALRRLASAKKALLGVVQHH